MRFTSTVLPLAAAIGLATAVPLTADDLTVRSTILPRADFPSSQSKKIRYGPFKLDAASKELIGSAAPIINQAEKPCATAGNEIPCTVLSIQAQIEYEDGKVAKTPGGVYAHHIALGMSGPKVKDATCGSNNMSLIYNTGNEFFKVVYIDIDSADKDGSGAQDEKREGGVYIAPENEFMINTLLMNPDPVEKNVYIAINYDFIPGENPKPNRQTHTVWLNVAQSADGKCTADDNEASRAVSDYTPPKADNFVSTSSSWIATFPGKLLSAIGHMHDGGVAIKFYQNDQLICTSAVNYDNKMAPTDATTGKRAPPFTTLAGMQLCDKINKEVKIGDKFRIEGVYDFKKNMALMEDDGSMSGVMATGEMFILQTGSAGTGAPAAPAAPPAAAGPVGSTTAANPVA